MKIESGWGLDHQFVVDKLQSIFDVDSLENTLALNHDWIVQNELSNEVSEFTYAKGASVIRMMQHILGEEKFIKGLRLYLRLK